MVKNWVDNVGDMKHTMHWSGPNIMNLVQRLHQMPLSELRSSFDYWDSVRAHMKGIADVLFTASCFRIPFVVHLGDLFWAFARELLLVKLDTSDDLNLFLSCTIMPQTVMVLGPRPYHLDSEVPYVPCNVTIMGSDAGVDSVSFTSTVIWLHEQGLRFRAGVYMYHVRLAHTDRAPLNCAIRVRGDDKASTYVRLEDVFILRGGVRLSKCRSANTFELGIEDALVGLYIHDVDLLSVNPRLDASTGFVPSEKALFNLCKTAIYIVRAKYFCSCFQIFHQCLFVYNACIVSKMVVTDCEFRECGKLGQVLGKQGAELLICRNYVSRFILNGWLPGIVLTVCPFSQMDLQSPVFKQELEVAFGGTVYKSISPVLLNNVTYEEALRLLEPEEA